MDNDCKSDRKDVSALLEEVKDWIEDNKAHFYENCKELYDEDNLERIKRFADSPLEYLKERMELNKEVLKNYHKLHHSILLAGITGFYLLIVTNFIKTLMENYQNVTINTIVLDLRNIPIINICVFIVLLVGPIIAIKIHLTYQILKWIGLLRVIRDAEIEVYYISKIMEAREKNET